MRLKIAEWRRPRILRSSRLLVVVAVLALIAASCATDEAEEDTTTTAPPGTTTTAEEEVEEEETTTTAVGLEGTYKVGVFGPATIPQGRDIQAGAELAVEEINEQNAAGGVEFEMVFCDTDLGIPDIAVQCVTDFLQTENVDAVVGGFSTGEVLAVLDTIVRGQVPYLSVSAASPEVTEGVSPESDRRFIFRIAPLDSRTNAFDICKNFLTLADQVGIERFGILFEDVEFARPLVDFLSRCLQDPAGTTGGALTFDGREVVATEVHAVDATDFSSQFNTLESAGAQFVIEINTRQEGVTLIRQWGELQPNFAIGGLNVSSQNVEFFEATGGNAAYELNGPASLVDAPITDKTIPFIEAYMEKFGRRPIFNGASTYDAVWALAESVANAGSTDPEAIVDALENMDRIGVLGRERFDERHEAVYGEDGLLPNYFQWKPDGSQVVIFPESRAQGEYELPPWVDLG